jgi:hypothetical protein
MHLTKALLGIALLFAVRSVGAQRADSSCVYEQCALSIVPRLFALDIVRGASEARVGSLAFLYPSRVTAAFTGSDAAQQHAAHAFRLRRVAAVLTDVGIVAVASAGGHAIVSTQNRRASATISGVGLAIVASSVPIHFAADGELSRAVWEFNRRFGR